MKAYDSTKSHKATLTGFCASSRSFVDGKVVSVSSSVQVLHEEIYDRTVIPFTLFTSRRSKRKAT